MSESSGTKGEEKQKQEVAASTTGRLPTLSKIEGEYVVCQIGTESAVPAWVVQLIAPKPSALGGCLVSVSRTGEELSIVAPIALLPQADKSAKAAAAPSTSTSTPAAAAAAAGATGSTTEFKSYEAGWSCIKVEGPLDFALIGILARIASTLAAAGVSIFAVSTYDTDYVLVKTEKLQLALATLSCDGYHIAEYASYRFAKWLVENH